MTATAHNLQSNRRFAKAEKLANALIAMGRTAADAERATKADWALAARKAGCRPPSETDREQQTKKLVIALLKEHEIARRVA